MKSLSVKLKNCYGIASLDHTFKFEKSRANLVYAPNGVMKTSFAKTFRKISQGEEPKEEIYNRVSSYKIAIDSVNLENEEILVVEPFDPSYESQNISALLVNAEKKKKYDAIFKNISKAKTKVISDLSKLSKIKKVDVENQLLADLGCLNIFEAIQLLNDSDYGAAEYAKVSYQRIFDPKVVALLNEPSVKENIGTYTTRYNELIQKSLLFKKGVFNPAKASTVLKTLKKEKFFEAEHKVLLNGKEEHISNYDVFEEVIEREKNSILNDEALQEISKKIVEGVVSIKSFQDVLEEFPEISAELKNLDELKKILWLSYFQQNKDQFIKLLALYKESKAELADIENEAQLEGTLWHEAYSIFEERFHVPFTMCIENHTNAILGTTAPNIVFSFEDENGEKRSFDRGRLDTLDCLSVGERRAMYLLYIIFEFKARLAKKQRTVIVVDDIADSFDYKNKYAIIEYLRELAEEDTFRLIVLTHNFDFYRTFQSRVLGNAKWNNSFVAQKDERGIQLLRGGDKNVRDPFSQWKKECVSNAEMLVSMIPFVRNLVEFKDGDSCDDYAELTAMLHIKPATRKLKLSDLERLIGNVVKGVTLCDCFHHETLVIDHIYQTADDLCKESQDNAICLAEKVALSVALRLKAEEFMWSKVVNKQPFDSYQTGKLFDRLVKEQIPQSNDFHETKKVLSKVVLMTPENIHINSFMYEPLVDMSSHHLVSLYQEVKTLLPTTKSIPMTP